MVLLFGYGKDWTCVGMKEIKEFFLAHPQSEIFLDINVNDKLSIKYEFRVPEKPRLGIYIWKSTSKVSSNVSHT